MIVDHFGKASLQEVIEALHFGRLPRAELGTLAPGVLHAASVDKDPTALTLVRRQAEEVVLLARVALQRLDLIDKPATIVLGGGVLTSRDPTLLGEITDGLAASAPRASWHVTEAAPVVGAGLLGLDRLGVSDDLEETVRASLSSARRPVDPPG